jgi:hypothetical protein
MGAPGQVWQKAPGMECSRGGLLPIWAIGGFVWSHSTHVRELMPKNGGAVPLSLSRYPLTRSVALVPLLGHSSAGGWREATAEPPPASRLAGSSRCECSYRAPADRRPDAWGVTPAESQSNLEPWQQTPEVSAHIGSLLPLGPPNASEWKQPPDVSAHIGRLLPRVGRPSPRSSPPTCENAR